MSSSSHPRPVDRARYDQALAKGFATPPPRKYDGPIIDIHTHAPDAAIGAPLVDAARMYGIRRLAVITGAEAMAGLQHAFSEVVPVPWLRWDVLSDGKQFAAVNTAIVEEAADKGARLIKLWFAPRFYDRYDIRLDDSRLDPVFDAIAENKLGVLVHVADPDVWFQRVYTDAARYGTKDAQYAQLEHRLAAHRDVPILVAHMGGNPEHLDELARMLDAHPNMYIDTSATRWIVRELGKQPAATRQFFSAYRDRILFGTDQVATKNPEPYRYTSRYWAHALFWESDAVVPLPIDDPDSDGEPLLRGVDLPGDVLPWIYYKNAQRVFRIGPGHP